MRLWSAAQRLSCFLPEANLTMNLEVKTVEARRRLLTVAVAVAVASCTEQSLS